MIFFIRVLYGRRNFCEMKILQIYGKPYNVMKIILVSPNLPFHESSSGVFYSLRFCYFHHRFRYRETTEIQCASFSGFHRNRNQSFCVYYFSEYSGTDGAYIWTSSWSGCIGIYEYCFSFLFRSSPS